MKVKTKTPIPLLAPCGMNCSVCYAHLRKKNTCQGCRGEEEYQPAYCRRCKIRNCAVSRGIDFCFVCESFPCTNIKQIDKRYRLRYHVSLIENVIRIQSVGIEQFLSEEKQKWMCAQCGGVVSLHDRICSACGKEVEQNT